MNELPEIESIDVANAVEHVADPVYFCVGRSGVTRIEAFEMRGMYSDIPYVRVWKGDDPYAEFCRHNIIGVYFKTPGAA